MLYLYLKFLKSLTNMQCVSNIITDNDFNLLNWHNITGNKFEYGKNI